jgi:hypothetical protein
VGWAVDQPQDPEHDPGQVSLEAAKRLATALALRLLASKERARRSMHAPLGDGDPMQGAVELTVALAVQAMALLLARGSIERGDETSPSFPKSRSAPPAESQESALESKRTTGLEPATFGLGSRRSTN